MAFYNFQQSPFNMTQPGMSQSLYLLSTVISTSSLDNTRIQLGPFAIPQTPIAGPCETSQQGIRLINSSF
jgi:hypothetical protein